MRRIETRVVHVDPIHPDAAALSGAASIIRAGGTVAFPTETVYGLGANGLDDAAVRRIFAAKQRPADNPLILHIAALNELDSLVTIVPEAVRTLAEEFWPGPLTLVLPRSPRVPDVVSAGLPTVAIRWPAHPVAQALVRAAGVPIAAPSANLSGRPSPTMAAHVFADLGGRIDLIIDGGPAAVGLESTVLDLVGPVPTLLRPGGITLEMLRSVLGEVAVAPGVSADPREAPVARPRSPGMKYRHYAPKAPLTLVEGAPEAVLGEIRRLVAAHPRDGGQLALLVSAEAAAGLRDLVSVDQKEPSLVILGRRGDPEGMAAALFARLRDLDEAGVELIIAEGYADTGVGLALMNRLRRAAGGRIVRV